MKKALTIIVITTTSVFAFADGHKAEHKAKVAEHKAAINAACAADASTAGCADKVVGGGLLKCLHAYKKEHKDFKISEGCKSSTKSLRDEKKEWKANKAAEKAVKSEEKADK